MTTLTHTTVALSDPDGAYLRGEHGKGAALAARLVVKAAQAMGARELIDIESAHVDGCIDIGEVSVAFAKLLRMLRNRTCSRPLYVGTGRAPLAALAARGDDRVLSELGVRIVTDTCAFNAPILGRVEDVVMTNSAKWAWYAPRNVGVQVVFAELENCVESAVAGRVSVV